MQSTKMEEQGATAEDLRWLERLAQESGEEAATKDRWASRAEADGEVLSAGIFARAARTSLEASRRYRRIAASVRAALGGPRPPTKGVDDGDV